MADTFLNISNGGSERFKDPVANAAALPPSGNTEGDTRVTLNDKSIYIWNSATSAWLEAATPAATSAITALNTDVSAVGPGAVIATIQPNVVTNTKLAQMPAHTIKGNNTASSSNAIDLTISQVRSELSINNVQNLDQTAPANIIQDSTHRFVSDTEKSTWNGKQDSLGFTAENSANKSTDVTLASNSDVLYSSQKATKTFGLSLIGGLPSGVYPTEGNKIDFRLSKDGLLIQSFNTPAFTSGAFNGGGTGSKGIVGFDNYNNLAFSALTELSFTARSVRDELISSIVGNIYWNILGNFNSGALTTANDYVNIAIDGLSQHKTNSFKYFVLTNTQTAYDLNSSVLATERMVKAVGGTEGASNVVDGSGAAVASLTCTYTSGSAIVTGCPNTASLIVGQYLAADVTNGEYGSSNKAAVGARILSVDSGTQFTMTVNAIASGSAATLFYGGINPPSRTVTCNGTTTITLTSTDDIQVNTLISGTGIPANSFVVSKVRNTSLTLNNSCPTGTPTASFIVGGKVGMPTNASSVGIPWATVVSNNPNGYFTNTAPTVAGGWAAADGGWPKNSVQSAFNLVQGGSSTLDARINSVKSVTINSDTYNFAL